MGPSISEWITVLAHLTLETGISLYQKEGGVFDSKKQDKEIERIRIEYFTAPTIGKALLTQAYAIVDIHDHFIKVRKKLQQNKAEKSE